MNHLRSYKNMWDTKTQSKVKKAKEEKRHDSDQYFLLRQVLRAVLSQNPTRDRQTCNSTKTNYIYIF